MATVTRFPSAHVYERTEINSYGDYTEAIWNLLERIEALDQNRAYTNNLAPVSGIQSKPARVVCDHFGFNLNANARLNSIQVIWMAYVRNTSGGTTNTPVLPGIYVAIPGSQWMVDSRPVQISSVGTRGVTFTRVGGAMTPIAGLDPTLLNSDNFFVKYNPLRNTSANGGIMYLDSLGVVVDYTNPIYSLSASLTSGVTVGDNITLTLTIQNTNDAHQGRSIPVSVNVPAGLEFVSDDGTYNHTDRKWLANLDANGKATVKIVFRTTTAGNKTLTASVDGFSYTISKTSVVNQATYSLASLLPDSVIQGHDVTYNITVTTNSSIISTVDVNIPIPAGFTYKSSTGNGSYNSSTHVWTAAFTNKTATLTFTMTAVIEGQYYDQTISTTNASNTRSIFIIGSNLTECNYIEREIPDAIKQYLVPGQVYIVSCNLKIVTEQVGAIYDAYQNFRLATITDEEETLGSRPSKLNISERVNAVFVYDPLKITKIRIYGQYKELSPFAYNLQFTKWSINTLTDRYEAAGGIPNIPGLLITDDNFAEITLDPGETSKNIKLSSFNFSGRESDPDLIIKGLGVAFEYICDTNATVNVTLSSNGNSSVRSITLDPALNETEIGSASDLWNLTNINLNDINIEFAVTNTSLSSTLIQIKDIRLVLYSKYDETQGNPGIIMDNEHSKNYDIFLINDTENNAGIASDIITYDVSNGAGELITGFDLKSKKIVLKFKLFGNSLEDAHDKLNKATLYLSNKQNSLGLPIPKSLRFDWDKSKEYMVILEDEIKSKLNVFTYSCEATYIVPEGLGFVDMKTAGAIGSNDGLVSVRPLITVLAQGGGQVQIFDNVTAQSVTVAFNFTEGTILIFDCEARTVKDSNGADYTSFITLNSTWPVVRGDFDYSNSTGCLIQTVQFREGM